LGLRNAVYYERWEFVLVRAYRQRIQVGYGAQQSRVFKRNGHATEPDQYAGL